jgi:SAM-dependent methyltransferase
MNFADLLTAPEPRSFLWSRLVDVFTEIGVTSTDAEDLASAVLATVDGKEDTVAVERDVKALLGNAECAGGLAQALRKRSRLVFRQVRDHVLGPKVLDLGCGDGRVGHQLSEIGCEVDLMDIIDYRDPEVRLPFTLNDTSGQVPAPSGHYDSVLLLTVLHHAEHPRDLLAEALRVCRGRVIIIESVYGIEPRDVGGKGPIDQQFAALGSHQWSYAAFVDWFYNRVLHDDVPVPFNFMSPSKWDLLFRELGARQSQLTHLGIDQPLVPEYHTLHVLSKSARWLV